MTRPPAGRPAAGRAARPVRPARPGELPALVEHPGDPERNAATPSCSSRRPQG
ncbi:MULTISPECIES: hypothetical protein [Streptomyces]|uniref:hypothetical protein n=1 Tax=Streptomyces TaxID=1883 RepID=UPI002F957112